MPRVQVPADATNYRLDTLLGASSPQTGYARKLSYTADPDNTGTVKVGGSSMTAANYDLSVGMGESMPDREPVMLSARYVRNDSGAAQHVLVNFTST